MYLIRSLIFTSLLFATVCTDAQPLISRRGPTLSVGGQIAVPMGEFADLYRGNPKGINASASFPFLGLPVEWGGGFTWNQIASEGRKVYVTDNQGGVTNGNLKINGNAYMYHLHARLRPLNGDFRPYGEVLAGFRNFSTKSKLRPDTESDFQPPPVTEVSNRDFTWITGWAVGLEIKLLPAVFLEGRFEKIRGDRVEYINPRSITIESDGSYSHEELESRTDQFAVSLGLAFSF